MKKMTTLILSLMIAILLCISAMAEDYNPKDFVTWVANEGPTGVMHNAFLPGAENRPSKEDMKTMLELANTYFQCHGLTGAHFVVVQGEEEQNSILNTMAKFTGMDFSGTVTVLVMADGVKDQEHHAAQYYPGSKAENGGNPEYWNMYFGIYEAGWATGYLNMLATSMGYRSRVFAALDIPNAETGAVDLYGTGGNFKYIQGENWDIQKYMTSKDGTQAFDHYVMALNDTIALDGNVTLLCAMVIGKIDETDAVSKATHYSPARMQNYDFWDWDDDGDAVSTEALAIDAVTTATAASSN